uniref:C2H2-type domain-containing protein n=1 Tax=Monopterus albus TaxID=43700 RepID=A0A3Q3JI75_MONAL
MSSGLLAPPGGGDQLCVFLLRAEGQQEEEARKKEVGCQWESPEEDRREVGCQSDSAERRDAAVQVDLSWTHSGQNHKLKFLKYQIFLNSGSTLSPPTDVHSHPSPSALGDIQLDSQSQHARLRVIKLEPDSTMCDVCGKVMKNKSSLARHSFIHTGKKPFACHLCNLRFNRRDNLQHHLNQLHPNGIAKLEKQREVQACCRSRLKTHEVIHSGVKPHRCDLCPKAYMRTNDLEHHKKIVHVEGATEPQRPNSLLCDFCGKEFKCRSQLSIHYQTHTGERPHLCDICGRKFGRQHQLKRHKVLVHANRVNGEEALSSEVAFTCSVCGKRLKSEVLLAAHSRIHTADKPHCCNICLHSFQSATCLKQHHRTAVTKVFPCPICSKVFKFKSLLASHSMIHSEIRPYACEFCSRSFRRLSHLKRHVIIHTGERPFACDLCTARFNRSGNLDKTVWTHTTVRTPHSLVVLVSGQSWWRVAQTESPAADIILSYFMLVSL